VRVWEKTTEIPVAKAVLPTLPIAGRIVTSDALHAHAAFMQITPTQGGKRVLTVKGNQPSLSAHLALYFAAPQALCQGAERWERRRGRLQHRVIGVTSEMNAYRAADWPLVAQVAELTRTVTKQGVTSTEVVYLIADLSRQQASPLHLLTLVRGHWGMEHRSHYLRDVSCGEDRARLRSGHARQILAAVGNVAITLLHRSGTAQLSSARRSLAYHPEQALALLCPKGGQQ
jgi:predicted transposase YbfD/YdcC